MLSWNSLRLELSLRLGLFPIWQQFSYVWYPVMDDCSRISGILIILQISSNNMVDQCVCGDRGSLLQYSSVWLDAFFEN